MTKSWICTVACSTSWALLTASTSQYSNHINFTDNLILCSVLVGAEVIIIVTVMTTMMTTTTTTTMTFIGKSSLGSFDECRAVLSGWQPLNQTSSLAYRLLMSIFTIAMLFLAMYWTVTCTDWFSNAVWLIGGIRFSIGISAFMFNKGV